MRYLVVTGFLLIALLPAPVHAQGAQPLAEDAEGDVDATVAGAQVGALADRSARVDLTALHWQETDEGFLVRVHVKDLGEPAAATLLDRVGIEVRFTYHGLQFVAEMRQERDLLGGSYAYGQLYTEGTDGYAGRDYREYLEITIDHEQQSMEAMLPREALTDKEGKPPTHGDLFADVWVRSAGATIFSVSGPTGDALIEVRDRMPDEGTVGPVEVTVGVAQDGDARLASEAPFRLSNGGASTVVYDVTASNDGERQPFLLDLGGVPDGWVISLPFDRVVLDEGERLDFPVLLTTPSGHSHGGLDAFRLTMTGQRDPGDVGRLEMGLKYTDIPQPAGHHPRLHFHSHEPYGAGALRPLDAAWGGNLFSYVGAYMNAAEDDPGDLGIDVPAQGSNVPGLGSYFSWHVPLSPGLGIGLDFDPSQDAVLELPLAYDYLAEDVTVSASLHHRDQAGQRTAIATSLPTTPTSWSQGTHAFEVALDVSDEADFIPYADGSWLELQIEAEGTFLGPGPLGPGANVRLVPGGFLDLPLREYRDPVDRFYAAVQGLRFGTELIERPVNPGRSVVFETTLRNDGRETEPIALNLTGLNSGWARIMGDDRFELASGQSRVVAVAVTVPGGVGDGTLVDLVLQAASERDVHRRALVDLIAVVDEEGDHPDDADRISALQDELSQGKKSPGFEIAAVALGLLAVAFLLRRRP